MKKRIEEDDVIYTIDKNSGDCIDIDVKPGVEEVSFNAENKYLGLQYRQNGNTHTETVCFLSSDITVLLKRNSFAKLNICDIHGNTKDTYTLKRR